MDKKGFLKIAEASISIVLIMGVLFAFSVREVKKGDIDLSPKTRDILEEIAKNSTLRDAVLKEDNSKIINFVSSKIPAYLDFEIRICEIEDICGKSQYTPGDIYVGERVISASINRPEFSPKKIKLFLWRK